MNGAPRETSSLVIVGETSTQEKTGLRRHAWVGYIYFLKSFAVQNRPPSNKIVTEILKTTMQSTGKAASFETRCNKESSEMILQNKLRIKVFSFAHYF